MGGGARASFPRADENRETAFADAVTLIEYTYI